MPIEEAFRLIRNSLDETTKLYRTKIEEIEEFDRNIEKQLKSKNSSIKILALSKELKKTKEESKRAILESKKKCEAIRITREIFGKSHILKKVVDFEALFINLNYINFVLQFVIDDETIAKIIGMAIYNNNKIYEKKGVLEKDLNSKHDYLRKESQAVAALKPYFAQDGTIVANDNVDLFVTNLTTLFSICVDRRINSSIPKEKEFSTAMLIELMTKHLIEANKNKPIVKNESIPTAFLTNKRQRREKMVQLRANEQELAKYFDGEKILIPCDSIDDFTRLVNSCNLNEENKTRIVNKMQSFLNKNDDLRKISFLNLEEQKIYKLSLDKKSGNFQVKELIDEIDFLLDMNNESLSKEDKEYIENEVKDLVKRLKFILNINVLSLQNK